jgi:hypothetical protein
MMAQTPKKTSMMEQTIRKTPIEETPCRLTTVPLRRLMFEGRSWMGAGQGGMPWPFLLPSFTEVPLRYHRRSGRRYLY